MERPCKRIKLRREAVSWSTHDVHTLLDLLGAKYDIGVINKRRQRNKALFEALEEDFKRLGKTYDWLQIREKWKYLKRCYRKYEDELKTGEVVKDWPYYCKLHILLTGGSLQNTAEVVIDYDQNGCPREDDSDTSGEDMLPAQDEPAQSPLSEGSGSPASEENGDGGVVAELAEVEGGGDVVVDEAVDTVDEAGTRNSCYNGGSASSFATCDIDRLVCTIKEEGEKNRKATVEAAELLVAAINNNVDKLLSAWVSGSQNRSFS